ncbi:MAG: phage virion morphogenesis protein [Leptospiraceae bacterium]|nr:phage virion morphogenesis protein [Leptospiraceae bacterium]
MGLTYTDTFGPVLLNAIAGLDAQLERATEKNAMLLQANLIKGIRNQKYRSQWPDLKPKTITQKEKKNLSNLILVGTGDLSSSFEVAKVSGKVFQVGTNNPYARAHEFGYAPRKIPARPYYRPAWNDSLEGMKENWREAFRRGLSL